MYQTPKGQALLLHIPDKFLSILEKRFVIKCSNQSHLDGDEAAGIPVARENSTTGLERNQCQVREDTLLSYFRESGLDICFRLWYSSFS
jgi:hypothetical protein